MRRHLFASLLAAVFLLPVLPASAQSPGFLEVTLSEDAVTSALAALPDVYAIAQTYEKDAPANTDDLLSGISDIVIYAAAKSEIDAALASHGYRSYEDWTSVFQTMMHAYVHEQSSAAIQQMAPMMEQVMQQIMSDPNIPQAQKDAMLAQMGGSPAEFGSKVTSPPLPENAAVVAAMRPQIQAALEALSPVN